MKIIYYRQFLTCSQWKGQFQSLSMHEITREMMGREIVVSAWDGSQVIYTTCEDQLVQQLSIHVPILVCFSSLCELCPLTWEQEGRRMREKGVIYWSTFSVPGMDRPSNINQRNSAFETDMKCTQRNRQTENDEERNTGRYKEWTD